MTLEATAGTAKQAIFQLQTNEATPSEKGSNLGKWPRFNSELPCYFPVTVAGGGQILSRNKMVTLLRLPGVRTNLQRPRTQHNLVHVWTLLCCLPVILHLEIAAL